MEHCSDIMEVESMRNQNLLISVIVPVYKVENYLHRCVDSILAQTYTNLEIILVDDGSPDRCGEICDEYAAKDSRIRVIHQENGGLSAARNAGLDLCTGEYIVFVDSDDYLDPALMETLIGQAGTADCISSGFVSVDENEVPLGRYCAETGIDLPGPVVLEQHYSGENARLNINSVYVWGRLYRRQVWDGLRFPVGLVFEDMFLMPHILFRCKSVKFVPYAGYYYRKTPGSITQSATAMSSKRHLADSMTIWDHHEELYKARSLPKLVIAVKCLRIEKIITHALFGSIPEELEARAKAALRRSVRGVLGKQIPLSKKIRYAAFVVFGKSTYKFLKKSARKKKVKTHEGQYNHPCI